MINKVAEIYKLLSAKQRYHLVRLQCLVVLMALLELVAVASVGPFMAVVGDSTLLSEDNFLAWLYVTLGFSNSNEFLFWLGMTVLITLAVAALISMLTTWRLAIYSNQVGAEISSRLNRYYMYQDWLFHANGSSSQLTNKVIQECGRLTHQVISPLMQINAKLVLTMVMSTAIFLFDPIVALVGITLFVSAYLVLFRVVRSRLALNGQIVTEVNHTRIKLLNEGFGGIKDTLLLGRQRDFDKRFDRVSREMARAAGTIQGLAQVPRYAMELVAFGAIIILVLYLLKTKSGDLGSILPVLSIYALAGFKLLPALQQIYAGISTLRSHLSAFDTLRIDLIASKAAKEDVDIKPAEKLIAHSEISLNNIKFHYPGKTQTVLNDLNMSFAVNKVTGIVGASGSGKSTVIDMLLGLIDPDQGAITIDGEKLSAENKRAWQNSLGFVPQSIFLADASIRENIAFGLPPERINEQRVSYAAKMAHLDELIQGLPDGLETRVGERGIQLSGGQRQRIGIARALYDDAHVMVFDEATSALDGITEKLIMDAIHDFSGSKTIIMIAHRLATVKQCDLIYLMDSGRVVDCGTYDDLVKRNNVFQRMADHS